MTILEVRPETGVIEHVPPTGDVPHELMTNEAQRTIAGFSGNQKKNFHKLASADEKEDFLKSIWRETNDLELYAGHLAARCLHHMQFVADLIRIGQDKEETYYFAACEGLAADDRASQLHIDSEYRVALGVGHALCGDVDPFKVDIEQSEGTMHYYAPGAVLLERTVHFGVTYKLSQAD